MFLQRALISFTFGPLVLYLIYLGGWFYFLPVTLLLAFAVSEYVQIVGSEKVGYQLPLALLLPLVMVQLAVAQWALSLFTAVFFLNLFIILCYILVQYERQTTQTVLADWMALNLGLFLLGWLGGHFFIIRQIPQTQWQWQWTVLTMVSVWVTDSGAYLVGKFLAGRILGRHLMTPRLSPNKTVEGLLGGVVLGTLITTAVASALGIPVAAGFFLGLLISCLSPAGDLSISLLKREAGVKDSGNLFPGHGGALDRIDSLIWGVTLAYYIGLFVLK